MSGQHTTHTSMHTNQHTTHTSMHTEQNTESENNNSSKNLFNITGLPGFTVSGRDNIINITSDSEDTKSNDQLIKKSTLRSNITASIKDKVIDHSSHTGHGRYYNQHIQLMRKNGIDNDIDRYMQDTSKTHGWNSITNASARSAIMQPRITAQKKIKNLVQMSTIDRDIFDKIANKI